MSRSDAPRASESGHWYLRTGEPCYEVMGANGKLRPATLKDARKLGLFPGVTTIIRCAAAPQLVRWQIDQGILAALTLPRTGDENYDVMMARIREDADAQAKKARDDGTRIHAAIQGHYDGKPPHIELWSHVKGVVETIDANFPNRAWKAEYPCAHEIGYGTKADLSCADVILDFKGADFDKYGVERKSIHQMMTYDEHDMQLAATRRAMGRHDAACAIVFVSRAVPGLAKVCFVDEPELKRGLRMFDALHNYWCEKNRYFPALCGAKEAA